MRDFTEYSRPSWSRCTHSRLRFTLGLQYAAFFIRRDSMTLGDSAQDSSAVPDDFLTAEVYKE
jgi:hypothetical protein